MKKILAVFGFIALVFALAACTPEKFTVTFDSNGGTNVPAVEVELDGKVAKPADPTKEGYIFVEWQLDGVKYEFETKVTKNITLKAKWNEKTSVDPIMETLEDVRDTLGVLIKDPKNILVGFNLPTKFIDDVVGVWKSSDTTYLKIGEPDTSGVVTTTVIRPESAEGNKVVKLSVVLSLEGKSVNWEIELTIIALEPAAYEGNSFKEGVTKELANETIKVSNVALYYAQGTNGYYLSTADGSLAFVYGTTGMPEAGKLYNITAKVENYYNALQIKDVNYQLVEGTPDHVVPYADFSIAEVVLLPKPSIEHVYGHDTYKFKDVKIIIDGTGNYNTFLVDKNFDPTKDKRTKENSIMFYYTSQINELRALQGLVINEIDLVLEGYRTDHNVWYFSYLKPIADIKLATLTDQEKADAAKNGLLIDLEFPKAGTITLPTTGLFNSTIGWNYKNSEDPNNSLLDLVTGAVTLPAEPGRKIVKIVATITNGEATATKEFDIKVGEYVLETIEDALLLDDGATIMIEGVITDKFANNTYGLQDETGAIAIYTTEALTIGRKYTIIGEKDTYKGLHQLKNITIDKEEPGATIAPTPIDDILDNNVELAKLIAGRVSISDAEVVEVGEPNASNNINVKIKKNGVTLEIRYDSRVAGGAKAEVLEALKVGDIVNYIGNLGWFNGPQLGYGPSTFVGEGEPDYDEFPTVEGAETIAAFLAAAEADAAHEGTIVALVTSLAPYNSFSVQDATGQLHFRVSGKNAANIDFGVGDVIIAKVKKGLFKGLIQGELVSGETYQVKVGNFEMFEAIDLNEVTVTKAFLEENQSRLVSAEGVKVVSVTFDTHGNLTVVVKVGEYELPIKYDNRMPGFNTAYLSTLEANDEVDIKNAVITVANDEPLLMIGTPQEISGDGYEEAMAKAAFEKDADSFEFEKLTLTEDTTLVLPTTYKGVTVVWSVVEGADHINLATGEVTIPAATAMLKLKAVFTKGELETERIYEFVLSVPVEGQVYHEKFDNTNATASYANNSFTGVNESQWKYVGARDEGDFPIDGSGIILRQAKTNDYLQVIIANGVSSFSFEYRKAFTGGTGRTYKVDVTNNGTTITYDIPEFGSGSGEQTNIYTFVKEGLNLEGEVIIKIYPTKDSNQTTIDNFKWTE